jgi:hypothetical protein
MSSERLTKALDIPLTIMLRGPEGSWWAETKPHTVKYSHGTHHGYTVKVFAKISGTEHVWNTPGETYLVKDPRAAVMAALSHYNMIDQTGEKRTLLAWGIRL